MEKGTQFTINSAEVVSCKVRSDRTSYGRPYQYVGVLCKDPKLGKVWFKTSASFAYNLQAGDVLSANLECNGMGDDIIFAKKPKVIGEVKQQPVVYNPIGYNYDS